MPTANEHYQSLLAEHYLWMFGISFAEKAAEQKAILEESLAAMEPVAGMAVDLGCGPGFQTAALLELGYAPVVAIDTSAELLADLRANIPSTSVVVHHADIGVLAEFVAPESAALMVCMGDTLTHLPSHDDLLTLLANAFRALSSGGTFLVTWRDLTGEMRGLDRIFPIRSDAATIMTCFVEYQTPETVMVHDLIHTRAGEGWALRKSCYPKLRIGAAWLADAARSAGFSVVAEGNAGRLQRLVARKA